nr:VQ motif-containing protein 4-like [Ipomoea batatas]GME02711.1 VQ motif-containing protein 4-like [Ipomoea batatas]
MEITSRPPRQESVMASPRNDGGGISSSAGNCSSSLPLLHHQIPTPPLTPKAISRSDASPYPTTFVQADTSTFKQGFGSIPPKKQGFKALYERRNSLKNGLMISPLIPNNSGYSPRKPEILSPSILDFPSLALSPVTPLNEDPFNKSSPSMGNSSSEEERAIAEKKFYLHPSPRTSTPRDSDPPQLLPLFPLTSPRLSSSSSSS